MRQSTIFLLASVLLFVAVSAQASDYSDYKVCHASLDISNHYKAPIMYTVTFNDTIFSRRIILPFSTRNVLLPYLVGNKETCNSSVISLMFRPSLECIDSVLGESHQYDTCLLPHDPGSGNAYKNVLLHLLSYGLKKRIDFSITIIDDHRHPTLTGHATANS